LRPEGSARTAHFAVALPVTSATRAELASLRVSGPGMSAASRASRAGRQAVLADIARAGDSTKVLRVSGGIVRVAYDAARWAGVMICDPDTHEVLAFGATGEALVSTNKQSLRLVFSDGVQSAAITLPVKESRP
jgi:hypothetical protein